MNKQDYVIERLLEKFRIVIGKDYDRYFNHVCRVYQNCLLLDDNSNNYEKYAIAAAYHDIGIWTDRTIDYLDPSIAEAINYLKENGYHLWTDEISQMIFWHHKVNRYHGKFEKTVETFRKADWIDVSLGLIRFSVNPNEIIATKKEFPNAGFHVFLLKQIARNFLKHPFNPLPMFKN